MCDLAACSDTGYMDSLKQWDGRTPRPVHPLERKIAAITDRLRNGSGNFLIESCGPDNDRVLLHRILKTSVGVRLLESAGRDIAPLRRLMEELGVPNSGGWMDLCYFEQDGAILYDRFYDDLPVGEGLELTNGEYLARLRPIAAALGFTQGDIVFIDDDRLAHKPLRYLLRDEGVESFDSRLTPVTDGLSVMPAELPDRKLFFGKTALQPEWKKAYAVDAAVDGPGADLLPEAEVDYEVVHAKNRYGIATYSVTFDGDCFGNTFVIARNGADRVKVTMILKN